MDYKTEMRKLIDIVKQQSFNAPLESTLEDLTTLSTAVKDLSDRINTRSKKSLYPTDKAVTKQKGKTKKANSFPSVKPMPIPKSKNTQTPSAPLQALSNFDFNAKRDDFVAKQFAVQSIKPQPPT